MPKAPLTVTFRPSSRLTFFRAAQSIKSRSSTAISMTSYPMSFALRNTSNDAVENGETQTNVLIPMSIFLFTYLFETWNFNPDTAFHGRLVRAYAGTCIIGRQCGIHRRIPSFHNGRHKFLHQVRV